MQTITTDFAIKEICHARKNVQFYFFCFKGSYDDSLLNERSTGVKQAHG
jgi:hypothetical protein